MSTLRASRRQHSKAEEGCCQHLPFPWQCPCPGECIRLLWYHPLRPIPHALITPCSHSRFRIPHPSVPFLWDPVCCLLGLPRWLRGKEFTYNTGAAEDSSSIPALGISPGEGHGTPFQYSCLGNPMNSGVWRALQSMGSQSVRHDQSHWAHMHVLLVHRMKWFTEVRITGFKRYEGEQDRVLLQSLQT